MPSALFDNRVPRGVLAMSVSGLSLELPTNQRCTDRTAILVLMLIERRDGNVAVIVNRPVTRGRDCGIVHGEREKVPASP